MDKSKEDQRALEDAKRVLARLEDLEMKIQLRRAEMIDELDKVVTQEQRFEMEEIRERADADLEEVEAEASTLRQFLRTYVQGTSERLDGSRLMVVPYKDRISWDTKGLLGYMVTHPEVAAFMTTKPSKPQIRSKK